ncbi:MAG: glycosyltransferase family 4 protein [Candidatus Kaiserbacteria bacterium]|nr:glycosyltransferase family 4 protein [Candidatus Kaiserbacteria bacterium]
MDNQKVHENHSVKIAYVVLGLKISGGIAVILQHTNRLMQLGYDVTLLNFGTTVEKIDWFYNETPIVNVNNTEDLGFFDIVIATDYRSVKFAKKIRSSRKIYFVQSDERRFKVDNIDAVTECEMSYKEDFEFMTMAKWIQRWLKEEFDKDAYYVLNGLDTGVFYKTDPIVEKIKKPRIIIEGSINIPFKGVEDSYEAVCDLDCEIWFVSNDGVPKKEWRYDRFFEKVPITEMKKIYSSCDILLKMSKVESFCYPPLEMMACGGIPVIREVTGIEEYAINENNCLIVSDIENAKLAVERLIKDKELRDKLIKNGQETAKRWSWDRSIDLLEKVIKKEPIEIFYTETFPEKYEYNKVIKSILFNLIEYERTSEFNRLFRKSILILKRDGLIVFFKKVFGRLKRIW